MYICPLWLVLMSYDHLAISRVSNITTLDKPNKIDWGLSDENVRFPYCFLSKPSKEKVTNIREV